jgi:hypothetical protein
MRRRSKVKLRTTAQQANARICQQTLSWLAVVRVLPSRWIRLTTTEQEKFNYDWIGGATMSCILALNSKAENHLSSMYQVFDSIEDQAYRTDWWFNWNLMKIVWIFLDDQIPI